MEISGNVGSSPIAYDVQVDAQLNIDLSLSYKDPGSQASIALQGKVPLAVILSALAAKSKSPLLSEAEQLLVGAAEAYIAAQPAKA